MSVINTDDGKAVGTSNPLPTQLMGSNVTDAKTPGAGDVGSLRMGYNGATWDRWRNNVQGALLASAARTAALASATQTNYNARGVKVILDITVASGTGGLTIYIFEHDPVTDKGVFILQGASVTATGTYMYELYPGASAAATGKVNTRVSATLGRTWHVYVSVGDGSSYTYSIGYQLIV